MMMEPPVPGGRLPPLKLLHGQAALDLDTPPPSPGVTSPGEPTILMVPVLKPRLSSFTAEEIDHSVATLDQCFQVSLLQYIEEKNHALRSSGISR